MGNLHEVLPHILSLTKDVTEAELKFKVQQAARDFIRNFGLLRHTHYFHDIERGQEFLLGVPQIPLPDGVVREEGDPPPYIFGRILSLWVMERRPELEVPKRYWDMYTLYEDTAILKPEADFFDLIENYVGVNVSSGRESLPPILRDAEGRAVVDSGSGTLFRQGFRVWTDNEGRIIRYQFETVPSGLDFAGADPAPNEANPDFARRYTNPDGREFTYKNTGGRLERFPTTERTGGWNVPRESEGDDRNRIIVESCYTMGEENETIPPNILREFGEAIGYAVLSRLPQMHLLDNKNSIMAMYERRMARARRRIEGGNTPVEPTDPIWGSARVGYGNYGRQDWRWFWR